MKYVLHIYGSARPEIRGCISTLHSAMSLWVGFLMEDMLGYNILIQRLGILVHYSTTASEQDLCRLQEQIQVGSKVRETFI